MTGAALRRVAIAAFAGLGLTALAPVSAHADTAMALLPGNAFVTFDTASPAVVASFGTITGLSAGDAVRAIDVRPADGKLYAAAVSSGLLTNSVVRTYSIDPATGAATLVGATAALPLAGDVATGWDFNPLVDRIRYLNVNEANLRINPTTGALAGPDTDLNAAPAPEIVDVAHDRNVIGAGLTTLFAINRATSQLATVGSINGTPLSPNSGVVTDLGPLGVTLSPLAGGGFDITPSGTAFAALTKSGDNVTRLYGLDLATGTATAIAPIALGTTPVNSLAILGPSPPVAPPPAAPLPPPPPPPPPAAPRDTTAPKVLVTTSASARLTPTKIKAIRIDFSCSEGCRAAGSLRVGKTTIASNSVTLRSADVARMRLGTTSTQRNAIGRLKRAGVRRRGVLTLTFTDAAGNRRTLTKTITLRP
jgi:hypothetical protein